MGKRFDYWTNIKETNQPATLLDLLNRFKNDGGGFRKYKAGEGEHTFYYSSGRIIVRGRTLDSDAYKLSILPKGILNKSEENRETLEKIISNYKIKLERIR